LKFVREQFFLAATAQNIPIDNTGSASHRLAELLEEKLGRGTRSREDILLTGVFQHPRTLAFTETVD
jgi:hypothetical protein